MFDGSVSPKVAQTRSLMPIEVVNVASVPHRSPFRYPGGKTWLVPEVRRWLATLAKRPRLFCEPFCGGAIAGLSALFEGLGDELVLVELDDDVAAVWKTIIGDEGDQLIRMIGEFAISPETVTAVLSRPYVTELERAFATILRNRVQRGGILAPGASLMKLGENGRGVASRWYPRTLQSRIQAIRSKRDRITFVHGDGIDWMRGNRHLADAVFFIDPPYTIAGRRLYTHSDVDHEELFRVASTLSADFLMTYDDAEPIRRLATRSGFEVHVVVMKNTHHRIQQELLVGRDLGWARGHPRKLIQNPLFEFREADGAPSH